MLNLTAPFPALISLVFGNAAVIYMNLVACRESHNSALLVAGLTVPLYWIMMSIAALKGTYQLIRNPSYWEKTFHGLGGSNYSNGSGSKAELSPAEAPEPGGAG